MAGELTEQTKPLRVVLENKMSTVFQLAGGGCSNMKQNGGVS